MRSFFRFIPALLAAAAITIAPISKANACTALLYTDANGAAYKGRTMEYSFKPPTSLTLVPAGSLVQSVTPDGKQGVTFNTRYAVLGMSISVVPGAKQAMFVDGMNDQGLSFSANQQNDAMTPPMGNDPTKILSANDFGSWILGNFKTVEEVKAAIETTDIWLPNIPFSGNVPTPLHYAIWDKSGNGIVVEFYKGKKAVYDNPVGAMTNGPEFSWHLTNLNNYTTNNVDQNVGRFGKLKVQTDDAGIALATLPSSQTCAGRFVKAAYYVNYVRKAKTPAESIQTLGHIMNNFDRPYDLSVDVGPGAGDGPRGKGSSSEVTEWTVMNDLSRNLYYVRSINAVNWAMVDLNKLKGVKKTKSISTYEVDKLGADATRFFLD